MSEFFLPVPYAVNLGPFRRLTEFAFSNRLLIVKAYSCFGCGRAVTVSSHPKVTVSSVFANLYNGCSASPCPEPCSWPTAICGETTDTITDTGAEIGAEVTLKLTNGPSNPQHNGLVLEVLAASDQATILDYNSSHYNNQEILTYLTMRKSASGWQLYW